MSLRAEFGNESSVLYNAGYREIVPRLSAFLDWMNSKPQIQAILDDLRKTSVFDKLKISNNFLGPDKLVCVNEKTCAAYGLAIIEHCKAADIRLSTFAAKHGIRTPDRLATDGSLSETVFQQYVKPLLDYVVRQLPEEVPTGSVVPFIPVAIQESLKAFQNDHPDASKVGFVMMQFSDTSAHTGIEAAIKAALKKHGLTGLLARDKEYHEDLYPNIQTYMHGSNFGIAVFERIEREVFNPNVSLEVGYMLALKKKLLLLKDKTLPALHADLIGRLYKPFDILDPAKTIPPQVEEWLEDKGMI